MFSSSYEITRAVIEKAAAAGLKIYERVPEKGSGGEPDIDSPYISMGPVEAHREDGIGLRSDGVFLQIDVWSWGDGEAYGRAEAMKLCGAVEAALHDRELVLSAGRLVTIEHRNTLVIRDIGGVVNHGVLSFRASIEAD